MSSASLVWTKDFSAVELVRIKMSCEPGRESEARCRDLAR